jgi:predicted hydrocarbon binding protein
MKARHEKLGGPAAVKAVMLLAHLEWAKERVPDLAGALGPTLDDECAPFVKSPVLATDWVPLRCLVAIDRAIALAVGTPAEQVFRDLGRHSAALNLGGVYRGYVADEPHRFFERAAQLHARFQNFGRARYERAAERRGRTYTEGYEEYSPVFCAGSQGYCEEALRLMHVPGPIQVLETQCQCAGDPACVFDLTW